MESTTQITHKTAKKTVKTFRDLGTWKAAYDTAIAVCRQCETFPEQAQVLAGQIAETAADICSNIAQGFGQRAITEKDCYYEAAQGLITRLDNQLLIAQGVGYISQAQYDDLARRFNNTHWILLKLQKISREWAGAKASQT